LDGLIKRVDYLVAEFMRSFWQASPQSKWLGEIIIATVQLHDYVAALAGWARV